MLVIVMVPDESLFDYEHDQEYDEKHIPII